MKHCSSCKNCKTNPQLLKEGIIRYSCLEFGYLISHPWFGGWGCIRYRKNKTWKNNNFSKNWISNKIKYK